jgi:D-aminopeptidase
VGGLGANSSGDLFLAFSTAAHVRDEERQHTVQMLSPDEMTPLFQATAEATEEAILNALALATTMQGLQGRTAHALPLDVVQQMLSAKTMA